MHARRLHSVLARGACAGAAGLPALAALSYASDAASGVEHASVPATTVAGLAWLSLIAAPASAALGAAARWEPRSAWRLAPLIAALAIWAGILAWVHASGGPNPNATGPQTAVSWLPCLGGALAIAALAFLGWGLGAVLGAGSPLGTAAATLLLAGLLALAPVQISGAFGGGTDAGRARLAGRLLDFSPWTFGLESAGVDWMRHPSVYGPARTDWYSDTRRPYPALGTFVHGGPAPYGHQSSGMGSAGWRAWIKALAAPLLVVVGCVLGLAAPTSPCPCASSSAPSPSS